LLRPIEAADLEGLAALLLNPGVARWWGAYDVDRVRAEFIEDPTAHGFVIESGGRLAGLIDFYEELEPDYRHASLDIAIADAFQRQAVGTDAMRTLMSFLTRSGGHHRLTVDPAAANLDAIHFYENLGFSRVGVMRCYERGADGKWHDGLLMERVECPAE
jgi:aminoglycoside 6'-N-acetyltransferase